MLVPTGRLKTSSKSGSLSKYGQKPFGICHALCFHFPNLWASSLDVQAFSLCAHRGALSYSLNIDFPRMNATCYQDSLRGYERKRSLHLIRLSSSVQESQAHVLSPMFLFLTAGRASTPVLLFFDMCVTRWFLIGNYADNACDGSMLLVEHAKQCMNRVL